MDSSSNLLRYSSISNKLVVSGAFLIILSSLIQTIDIFGFSIPFNDEWDAEAYALYAPFLNGDYSLLNLFDPHNGHIILFTRITSLSLFLLNSGWDPELQMLVGDLLQSLTGATIIHVILRSNPTYLNLFSIWMIGICVNILCAVEILKI